METVSGIEPRVQRLVRRHMSALVVTQALTAVTTQVLVALGSVMVLRLGGGISLTGLVLSMFGLGQLVTAYPAGRLMDRHGRRVVLVAGAAASAAAAALIVLAFAAGSLWGMLAAVAVFGAAAGPNRQLPLVAADLYPARLRGRAVGMLLMGSVIGAVLTPPLVDLLTRRPGVSEAAGITVTWEVGVVLLALSVPALLTLRPDPLEIARQRRDEPDARGSRGEAVDGDRPTALAAAIGSAAAVWGLMAFAMALTPLALHTHGHGLGEIARAVSIHTIGMYAFGAPLGALADRAGRRPLLVAALAATGLGMYGAIAATTYWPSTLWLFVVGVGWSAGVVSATALLSDHTTPEQRGRTFGVSEFVSRVATLLFPAIGSWLIARYGFAAAGVAVASLAAVPLVPVLRLPPRRVAPAPAAE